MSETTRTFSPRLRWLVPAATAVAVGLAFTIPNAMAEASPPDLPVRSASEILTSVLERSPEPISGTVVHTSRLGLPELPTMKNAMDPLSLLTGSTTIRVWSDGTANSRMNLVGETSEFAVVARMNQDKTAGEVWSYSSADNAVSHYSSEETNNDHRKEIENAAPDALADKLLENLDKTTTVTVDRAASIAGRDSYQLVFTPKDDGTLIGSVRIAIDAETYTPLRVQIWSTQDSATAALETAFTEVSFEQPDASVFDFVPPAGAEVTEVAVPKDISDEQPAHDPDAVPTRDDVEVVGSGWASIIVLANVGDLLSSVDSEVPGEDSDDVLGGNALASMLTPAKGGKALSSNLVSVLITDDGRVLAGAVPLSALEAAAQ